jgi:FdhD protein
MSTREELAGERVEAAYAQLEQTERPGGRPSERAPIVRVRDGIAKSASDLLAAEEPLEIRLAGKQVAVTMRTPAPGEDAELALGFLLGEAIIEREQVARISECRSPDGDGGIVDVSLHPGTRAAPGWQRNFYASSSCGICGKASIEAVRQTAAPLPDGPRMSAAVLSSLPESLRPAQRVFERTGGLHAAALFDSTGELAILREDIGRHNAVDKVVGAAVIARATVTGRGLLVTGRISAELAFKAARAGLAYVATPSVPSTLALTVARRSGMVLVGRAVSGTPHIHRPEA